MKLTHGLIQELYEKAKESDATVWFEGLRIQDGTRTLHIVAQQYPAQKLIRLVKMIHIHMHLVGNDQREDILLYHDGGKEDTEIDSLDEYPELKEAIFRFAQDMELRIDISDDSTRE